MLCKKAFLLPIFYFRMMLSFPVHLLVKHIYLPQEEGTTVAASDQHFVVFMVYMNTQYVVTFTLEVSHLSIKGLS